MKPKLEEDNGVSPSSEIEEASSTSVDITDSTVDLKVDDTKQLEVSVTPDNAEVTYKSSNEDVATVTTDGLVTAVAEGSAIITASVGAVEDTVTVNVAAKE